MAQRRKRLVFVEAVPVGIGRFVDTLVVKVGNETMWKEFGLIPEFVKSLVVGLVGKKLVVKFKVTFVLVSKLFLKLIGISFAPLVLFVRTSRFR